MPRVVLVAPLALIAILILLWSQRQTGPYFVSGYVECDEIRLGSRVGGRVVEVQAVEGQPVTRGQPLVRLDPFDLNERLAEARSLLASQRARLEKLQAGFRSEEIEQARARRDQLKAVLDRLVAGLRPLEIQIKQDQLREAQAELAWAETDHERVFKLFQQSQSSKEELDSSVRRLETARARFAAASDELELAQEGTRKEEIAAAQASLAEAQANLALLEKGYRAEDIAEAEAQARAAESAVAAIERQMAELQIVSPIDGTVDAVDLQPGDLVAPNAPVLTLLDTQRLWIRAYVAEDRIGVKLGQPVRFRVDAYPVEEFRGHISFVSRQAEFTPANVQTPEERVKQVFRIKVTVEGATDKLRAGMSADVFLDATE